MGEQELVDPSEGTERVTNADLLAVAADPAVTARTLEYWRHAGLLPKAERTGQTGKRPEWTYPVTAAAQLAALLRLRDKTKKPDVLRVALWFEGFPIDIGDVRTSIAAVLQGFLAVLTDEVEKRRDQVVGSGDSNWAALEQIGRLLARKRGSRGAPRYGRQTLEDRERAMTLIVALGRGDAAASEHPEHDAHRVERMMGLDRGRRPSGGHAAWLDGPASDGLDAFAHLGSLPALIKTMETATDDELSVSRTLARTLLDGITAFARLADAFALTENAVGLAAIEEFRHDPATAVWLTALIIGISRSSELNENLRSITHALTQKVLPIEERARQLAALTAEDLQQRLPELKSLPFIEQLRLERLIADYRDEQPEKRPRRLADS